MKTIAVKRLKISVIVFYNMDVLIIGWKKVATNRFVNDLFSPAISLYPALENLTEPHRLQATLSGTIGVARAMMTSPKWYPEGKLHIIPILQLCLPGIDSNDARKTMVSKACPEPSECALNLLKRATLDNLA